MRDKILKVLSSIGLSKNEVKVFLDLIKKDFSSALEISRRTEIHRSNVYDSLRGLMEKGLVSEITKGKKKFFQASEIAQIKEYVIQRQRDVDSIMPELGSISAKKEKRGSVSVFQGAFAFRSALMELLELNETINVYGIPSEFREIVGEGFLRDFHSERVRRKITMRGIYNKDVFDELAEDLKKIEYMEARRLPLKYQSSVITAICGNRVFVVVFGAVLSVVEIVDENIASSYGKYFEILWNYARMN